MLGLAQELKQNLYPEMSTSLCKNIWQRNMLVGWRNLLSNTPPSPPLFNVGVDRTTRARKKYKRLQDEKLQTLLNNIACGGEGGVA